MQRIHILFSNRKRNYDHNDGKEKRKTKRKERRTFVDENADLFWRKRGKEKKERKEGKEGKEEREKKEEKEEGQMRKRICNE